MKKAIFATILFVFGMLNVKAISNEKYYKTTYENNVYRVEEINDETYNNVNFSQLSNDYVALTNEDDKVSNVENDVSEMKKDLKDIKEKPIKEYENTRHDIKKQIISFVLGIILMFLAFKLGLGKFL